MHLRRRLIYICCILIKLQESVSTYSLCGGFWSHAVFADGQFERVLDARFQLSARDPQNWTAGAEAKVQTGAVLWTLGTNITAVFYYIYLNKNTVWYWGSVAEILPQQESSLKKKTQL